jgi:hypothetical protein
MMQPVPDRAMREMAATTGIIHRLVAELIAREAKLSIDTKLTLANIFKPVAEDLDRLFAKPTNDYEKEEKSIYEAQMVTIMKLSHKALDRLTGR